jgi:hypothetical protein
MNERYFIALMAGIKLASCVVNNSYGKSSFREDENTII